MVKAFVRLGDGHHALQQDDDDDPYGDLQSGRLPVQRWRTQIRADTAANATLTLSAHHITATSEATGEFDLLNSTATAQARQRRQTQKAVQRM